MKKILITVFIAVISFILSGDGYAYIQSGSCKTCHTMHGSSSLKYTCWGCHTRDTDNNIDPLTGAPQINHTNVTDLAGGNFAYITGSKAGISGDKKTRGHNVKDTDVIDTNFLNGSGTYPPGDQYDNYSEGLTNSTFTCAGKYGCHGDRTIEDEYTAIRGTHHYNDSALQFGSIDMDKQALTDGTTGEQVGSSYRFLKGVKGGEEAKWMGVSPGPDTHNEYFGATSAGISSRNAPAGNTISGLCAECHGNFHGSESGETGSSSSPWTRHPTDISLPGAGTEYAKYTIYSIEVPVARTGIPDSPKNTLNPDGTTDDIVMCLSCHRTHASPYEDLLRFNYADMIAGDSSKAGGCFTCHTSKNGGS